MNSKNKPVSSNNCLDDEIDDNDAIQITDINDLSESESDIDTNIMVDEIIYPGLPLKKEYILLRKIGFGANAAVWMAYRIPDKSYVAIKIQNYHCYEDGCREISIMKQIKQYALANIEKKTYCIYMIEYFIFEENEEMRFVCSVYDLYAGSIQLPITYGKYKYGLPVPVVKRIIKQLLTALDILHTKLKVIHVDVKPENILFKGIPSYHRHIVKLFEEARFQEQYEKLCKKYQLAKQSTHKLWEEIEALAQESVSTICKIDDILIPSESLESESSSDDGFVRGDDDDSQSIEEDIDHPVRRQSIEDTVARLDYSVMHDFDTENYYEFKTVLNNRQNSTDTNSIINDCLFCLITNKRIDRLRKQLLFLDSYQRLSTRS